MVGRKAGIIKKIMKINEKKHLKKQQLLGQVSNGADSQKKMDGEQRSLVLAMEKVVTFKRTFIAEH